MIYVVKGEVIEISTQYLVVDTGSIGYLIYTTANTLTQMHIGQQATIYTSMVVREDSITLYGFSTTAERQAFNVLLGLSGVGPKLALACLNVHTPETLAHAVSTGDLKALEKIPGVGKKSAQRMILEIADKLVVSTSNAPVSTGVSNGFETQVSQAIVQLGWNQSQADDAVAIVSQQKQFESVSELLKATLVYLGGNRG